MDGFLMSKQTKNIFAYITHFKGGRFIYPGLDIQHYEECEEVQRPHIKEWLTYSPSTVTGQRYCRKKILHSNLRSAGED